MQNESRCGLSIADLVYGQPAFQTQKSCIHALTPQAEYEEYAFPIANHHP